MYIYVDAKNSKKKGKKKNRKRREIKGVIFGQKMPTEHLAKMLDGKMSISIATFMCKRYRKRHVVS